MTGEKPIQTGTQRGEGAAGQKPRAAWRQIFGRQEFGVFIILAAMVLFLAVYTKTFVAGTNISNILRDFSWIAIAAFGECMIVITGGIDLSVGSVMGLSGLITAMLFARDMPIPVAVAGGLDTGLLVGLVNGLMITKGGQVVRIGVTGPPGALAARSTPSPGRPLRPGKRNSTKPCRSPASTCRSIS